MRLAFHRDHRFDSIRHTRIHIGGAEVTGVGQQLRRYADLLFLLCQYRQHRLELPTVIARAEDYESTKAKRPLA